MAERRPETDVARALEEAFAGLGSGGASTSSPAEGLPAPPPEGVLVPAPPRAKVPEGADWERWALSHWRTLARTASRRLAGSEPAELRRAKVWPRSAETAADALAWMRLLAERGLAPAGLVYVRWCAWHGMRKGGRAPKKAPDFPPAKMLFASPAKVEELADQIARAAERFPRRRILPPTLRAAWELWLTARSGREDARAQVLDGAAWEELLAAADAEVREVRRRLEDAAALGVWLWTSGAALEAAGLAEEDGR